MTTETHRQLANDTWSICNMLRGPYKLNKYHKVIMPLTVLRRFDCLLIPTKAQTPATFKKLLFDKEGKVVTVTGPTPIYPAQNSQNTCRPTSFKCQGC